MPGVSEESFRLIVETIPGLIAAMTPAGSVEHVNRQVLEYFGRTLDELKQWGTSDAVHPDDLPRVIAAWTHALRPASHTNLNTACGGLTACTVGFSYAACHFATMKVASSGGMS